MSAHGLAGGDVATETIAGCSRVGTGAFGDRCIAVAEPISGVATIVSTLPTPLRAMASNTACGGALGGLPAAITGSGGSADAAVAVAVAGAALIGGSTRAIVGTASIGG